MEIGGYIELETNRGDELHKKAIALNCARNCLLYLIYARGIRKIYLPFFICDSVVRVCEKAGAEIEYYHINKQMKPLLCKYMEEGEWFYLVNYYGQLSNADVYCFRKKYGNIIVDNVQAFFQRPAERIDTIYTCRKFFGVPDGAYLYTDMVWKQKLETDVSYQRMQHLLGRFEKNANEFYNLFVENEKEFDDLPVKKMSKLTHNLLRTVDYNYMIKKRTNNFKFLCDNLKDYNQLDVVIPEGAFMYPLYLQDGCKIRTRLRQKKVYIPTLWEDVFYRCEKGGLEYDMAANILPLPVDQRYGTEEMKYMVNEILNCIRSEK